MSVYISDNLRRQIEQADRGQCCYCQTQEINSGIPLSLDHILPQSKGGKTSFNNLCLACRSCNEFKSNSIEGFDLLTETIAPLFNPRLQKWKGHFRWSDNSTRVEGITATGRATVVALQMNRAVIVAARARWVLSGWHPPKF